MRHCISSPTIRRRIVSWRPRWCGILSPTTPRRMPCAASRACCATPAAISALPPFALTTLDAAWQPATKLRTPQDFVIASLRALDLPPEQRTGMNLPGILASMGQPFWNAPQPNGWPDRAIDWAAPEAMMRRIDWAYGVSGRVAALQDGHDAAELAETTLGPLLSDATLQAVHRAGSRRDAMTLLLSSPEFQRR